MARRGKPRPMPYMAPKWEPRGQWVGPLRQWVVDATGSGGRAGWKIVAQERLGLDFSRDWIVSPVFLPPIEQAIQFWPDNRRWNGEPLPFSHQEEHPMFVMICKDTDEVAKAIAKINWIVNGSW